MIQAVGAGSRRYLRRRSLQRQTTVNLLSASGQLLLARWEATTTQIQTSFLQGTKQSAFCLKRGMFCGMRNFCFNFDVTGEKNSFDSRVQPNTNPNSTHQPFESEISGITPQ